MADQAGVTSTANVSVVVNPDQGEVLSGLGGRKRFTIPRGSGTTTIANFGGVGRGDRPSPAVIAEADTLVFQGADLIARNLLLDQVGSDLQLTFEGVPNTTVVLKDFALENLDNLRTSNGASVNLANIFFNGDTSIRDSFDVFDANSTRTSVFRTNTVTFLNDLNNVVRGFDGADVINGQGGNDTLYGLEGNDLLRGGIGNDLLYGDAGNDRLVGGLGADQFVFRTGEPFEAGDLGIDTIVDFNGAEGDKIALRRRTFASLSSPVGNGLNANDFAVINAPTNGSAGNLAARIIYNQGTGDLIYNQNGAASGLGSGGRFATLTASPTLTANDFRIFA
uniref:Calcium-binding protein n=1 Tax=Oscillatoriales cyanobacterium SpSt-418 TaxID=2282169 RepID=A0A7C3PDL9_9CYAN